MTSVPRLAMKRNDTRKYSLWAWTKGYLALILTSPIYLTLWVLATFVRTLPVWMNDWLFRAHARYTTENRMDFRIPPDTSQPAYMLRWWRIARNPFFNIYYHIVLRSDDDRALHDHPWWSFSVVLGGGYFEHTIRDGGTHHKEWRGAGSMTFRWHGKKAHRLELADRVNGYDETVEMPATTIFVTGPVLRRWGFHDEKQWVDAYDWDAYCEEKGVTQRMKMAGGSDAVISDRNLI